MRQVACLLVLLGSLFLLLGCGGKEIGTVSNGSHDGGDVSVFDASSSQPDSATGDETVTSSDATTGLDSPTTSDAKPVDAGLTCTLGASAGSGGSDGACSTTLTETCSNGHFYQAQCECPQATCDCETFFTGEQGEQEGQQCSRLAYGGCTSACGNANDAWKACGYPQ
jgi:hypothetical protein